MKKHKIELTKKIFKEMNAEFTVINGSPQSQL